MSEVKRNITVTFLFLVCVYGLYAAYTRGNANAWYFKAEFALNDWAAEGEIPNIRQYTETLAAIEKAHSLDPGHPHYVHMLGRIIHWGIDNEFESIDKLSVVKRRYLEASELRPLWPDPWVDLARLNHYLHGYNAETQFYLERALKTGPFVDLVTISTAEILLLHWEELSGADRALLFEQFDIATKQAKVLKAVLDFAQQIEQEKLLCLQLKFNPDYKKQKESRIFKQFCK